MEYDDGYSGPSRVWLHDQDIPGLAMSRSLGDTVAHSVGRRYFRSDMSRRDFDTRCF